MAPAQSIDKRLSIPPDVRHNGVLILFHQDRKSPQLIYTLRSNNLADHSGQVCFPGGSVEPYETLEETAIREVYEEIGLKVEPSHIIGKLTPLYVPPSGNIIHPFMAYQDDIADFTLQPEEVSEAFRTSMDDLINEDNMKSETWNYKGQSLDVPFWNLHRVPLWGATAMITSELIEIYRQFLRQN